MRTRFMATGWLVTTLLLAANAPLAFCQEGAAGPARVIQAVPPDGQPPADAEAGAARAKPKKVAPKPLPARFEATVYQLDLPADQIASLDARSLAGQAKTAGALEAALKSRGTARPLYRVDQSVDLRTRAQLTIMSQVPVLTSTSTVGDKKTTSISRESLGAKFTVQCSSDLDENPTGTIAAAIMVEIFAMSDSGIETGGVQAKVHRTVTQSNGGSITLGKPLVLITADASCGNESVTAKSTATAFITLIQLSADAE